MCIIRPNVLCVITELSPHQVLNLLHILSNLKIISDLEPGDGWVWLSGVDHTQHLQNKGAHPNSKMGKQYHVERVMVRCPIFMATQLFEEPFCPASCCLDVCLCVAALFWWKEDPSCCCHSLSSSNTVCVVLKKKTNSWTTVRWKYNSNSKFITRGTYIINTDWTSLFTEITLKISVVNTNHTSVQVVIWEPS